MDAPMEKWQRPERVRELENAADQLLEELVSVGLVSFDDPPDGSALDAAARRLSEAVDNT